MCDKSINNIENNSDINYEGVISTTTSDTDNRISIIVEELNSIFKERLTDIECRKPNGDGNINELKSLTYKEWNEMLMDMIKNMIDAFSELEIEATRRISLLEKKLNYDKIESKDSISNISADYSSINSNDDSIDDVQELKMKISHLQSDIDSLLELIRKAAIDNKWSTSGLQFYTINEEDIFMNLGETKNNILSDKIEKMKSMNSQLLCALQEVKKLDSERHVLKTEISRKDIQIAQLEAKINKLESEDNPCTCCLNSCIGNSSTGEDSFKKLISELRACLIEKELQITNKTKENDNLMLELKQLRADITDKEKVADKHDQLQDIKSQLLTMEDELQQAQKKIHFKDNVIKDLRKECKNNLKFISYQDQDTLATERSRVPTTIPYQSAYQEIDNSSFSRTYSRDLIEQREIMNYIKTHTNNNLIKNEEQIGDMNLNDMEVEFEKSKHRSYSAEEACYMKILGIELEDLLDSQKDFNSEQFKQFNVIHKTIKEKCSKMIHDLVISNAKLNFVRNKLMMIAELDEPIASDSDPGYISLEEKEPEESMISTVCEKISNLQNENKRLHHEISKLQLDIQNVTSNVSQKIAIIEKNGRLLKDVASCLSSICGKSISLENLLLDDMSMISSECQRNRSGAHPQSDGPCNLSIQDNPLCAAIMDLEKEIIQRNNTIAEMKKITSNMEKELNCSNTKISILESETSYKDKTIAELQDKNNYQKQSIQKLECEKRNCIDKLRQYTETDLQIKYAELFAVNQKLETELNSQFAFDVLLEQLANHFDENYQLEKMLWTIRDENLAIKENLIDAGTEFRQLEHFYFNLLSKEKQLQCQIASLEGVNQQQETKFKEIYQKYQTLLDTLQRFKARCKCGEARFIEFDESDTTVLDGRKGKELPHIFDLLERKTEELKRINEQASNERTRLTKKIFDLEEDRNKLQIKIAVLENSLSKKETELRQSVKEYDTKAKSTIEKLTRELNDERIQFKNRELQLESDMKTMRKCMDVEKGAIIKSNDTMVHLEKQIALYREKSDAINKENAIYKGELFTLKGQLATFEGTERSLKEQLLKTQEELYNMRCNFQKTNSSNEELENLRKTLSSQKEVNYKVIRQYNDLIEDYNRLLEEYTNLMNIKEDLIKEIHVHRKWQHEASTQDNLVEKKINKMQEHINTLEDDREGLISKLNELHRDSIVLSSELERYKECFADTFSEAQYRTDPSSGDYSDSITSKILRTATKLSHARAIWSERQRRYSK